MEPARSKSEPDSIGPAEGNEGDDDGCRSTGSSLGHRPASRGSFREEVLEILRPIVNRDGGLVHWLVRQIELVRRERLVDEAGQLLDR
jgi:hypothetical protein